MRLILREAQDEIERSRGRIRRFLRRSNAVLFGLAPALAFGLAIGGLGNWWAQQFYGPPSAWWWAVRIAPEHRVPGYENYATFQPAFLYLSLWEVALGFAVIWAARRFLLTESLKVGKPVYAFSPAVVQEGALTEMTFPIDYILADLCRHITLLPGDIVLTGTHRTPSEQEDDQ